MAAAEIVARRRKWAPEEKAALLAEVETAGGRVSVVAQRHGISDSLLYNWRSAWKAAAVMRVREAVEFMPIGTIGRASESEPTAVAALKQVPPDHRGDAAGWIEIELPGGARSPVWTDR
jgi:transposase